MFLQGLQETIDYLACSGLQKEKIGPLRCGASWKYVFGSENNNIEEIALQHQHSLHKNLRSWKVSSMGSKKNHQDSAHQILQGLRDMKVCQAFQVEITISFVSEPLFMNK